MLRAKPVPVGFMRKRELPTNPLDSPGRKPPAEDLCGVIGRRELDDANRFLPALLREGLPVDCWPNAFDVLLGLPKRLLELELNSCELPLREELKRLPKPEVLRAGVAVMVGVKSLRVIIVALLGAPPFFLLGAN